MKLNFNSPGEPENTPTDKDGKAMPIRYVEGASIRLTNDDSVLLFLKIWGARSYKFECFAFTPRGAALTGDALEDAARDYLHIGEHEIDVEEVDWEAEGEADPDKEV